MVPARRVRRAWWIATAATGHPYNQSEERERSGVTELHSSSFASLHNAVNVSRDPS